MYFKKTPCGHSKETAHKPDWKHNIVKTITKSLGREGNSFSDFAGCASTVLLILSLVFFAARLALLLPNRMNKDDFNHYYVASRIFLSGQSPYGKNLIPYYAQFGFDTGNNPAVFSAYPPFFLRLFSLFAVQSPRCAYISWLIFQLFCLAWIYAVTLRLIGASMEKWAWRLGWAMILASNWLYYHFYYSQAGLLLCALIISACLLHTRKKFAASMTLVATAGMIKLFPFYFIPWAMWDGAKRRCVPFTAIMTASACITVLFILSEPAAWIDYLANRLPAEGTNTLGRLFNYSIPSFFTNICAVPFFMKPPGHVVSILITCGVAIALLVSLSGYAVFFWKKAYNISGFCLLIMALLLANPRTFGHYLVFLILPHLLIMMMTTSLGRKAGFAWLVVAYILSNTMEAYSIFGPYRATVSNLYKIYFLNYIPLYGMLIYVSLIVHHISKRTHLCYNNLLPMVSVLHLNP